MITFNRATLNKTFMEILIIVLVVVGLLALWLIATFNSLVKMRNRVDNAWSDIDTVLQERWDAVTQIVNTVKGAKNFEKDTLTQVTEARNMATKAGTPEEHAAAENMLTQSLKSLFAVAEAYPDLKATSNFQQLQEKIGQLEDKINSARRFYNGTVREFNTKIQVFPNNLFAGMLGFTKYEFYDAPSEVEQAPQINFDDKE